MQKKEHSFQIPSENIKILMGRRMVDACLNIEYVRFEKPEIVILAETKAAAEDPKFNIDGYYIVTEITRKAKAGSMVVHAIFMLINYSFDHKNCLNRQHLHT